MIVDDLRDERLGLVARLRDLPAAQWQAPSLCAGWTVHHVLAHVTGIHLLSPRALAVTALRARGVDRTIDALARRVAAAHPPGELLDVLEAHAASTRRPPGVPVQGPFTDAVVHGVDVRWALGDPVADTGARARLRPVLDFLVGPRAVVGFVPPRRLRGLRLVADDLDWSHGRGAEVRGPALALVAGVLGRGPALAQLSGEGTARLR